MLGHLENWGVVEALEREVGIGTSLLGCAGGLLVAGHRNGLPERECNWSLLSDQSSVLVRSLMKRNATDKTSSTERARNAKLVVIVQKNDDQKKNQIHKSHFFRIRNPNE